MEFWIWDVGGSERGRVWVGYYLKNNIVPVVAGIWVRVDGESESI
jgi:hypothetical protein